MKEEKLKVDDSAELITTTLLKVYYENYYWYYYFLVVCKNKCCETSIFTCGKRSSENFAPHQGARYCKVLDVHLQIYIKLTAKNYDHGCIEINSFGVFK